MPKGKQAFKQPKAVAKGLAAPTATSSIVRKPLMKPLEFENSEEVGDISVVEAFENTPLLITFTNPELFPFGHKLARLFHSRKWKKLVFRYEASTQTETGGTVALSVSPDPEKPPFTDMKQALNNNGSAMSAPWVGFAVDGKSKTADAIKQKFNADVVSRVGGALVDDLHTVADGVLNVAVQGLQTLLPAQKRLDEALTAAVVTDGKIAPKFVTPRTPDAVVTGKLWVDYIVQLFDPVDQDPEGGLLWIKYTDTGNDPRTFFGDTVDDEGNLVANMANELDAKIVYAEGNTNTESGAELFFQEAGIYVASVKATVSTNTGPSGLPLVDVALTPQTGFSESISAWSNKDIDATGHSFTVEANMLFEVTNPNSLQSQLQVSMEDMNGSGEVMTFSNIEFMCTWVGDSIPPTAISNYLRRGGLKCPKNRRFFQMRAALLAQRRTEELTAVLAVNNAINNKRNKKKQDIVASVSADVSLDTKTAGDVVIVTAKPELQSQSMGPIRSQGPSAIATAVAPSIPSARVGKKLT